MRALLAACLFALHGLAFGQAAEVARPDPAVEARLKGLAEELRCLVCQNQTIADSSAPLALDLRNQIRGYMVERYGDFVLYRPPLRATTLILWVGPFVLLAAALAVYAFMVRRRPPPEPPQPLERQRRESVAALLEGNDAPAPPPADPRGGKRPRRSGH